MQERREYSRVRFVRDVVILLENGATMLSTAEDFSLHGMALITQQPLAPGCLLSVEFNILGQDDWREINLRGRVVYSIHGHHGYKSGITYQVL